MDTSIETQWIEISRIDLPEYGRRHSPDAVKTLAGDIAKNGQLQNAVVAKSEGGRYELVIGKGRLEAVRQLGWEKIRADVKEGLSQVQKLAMVAAENEAREDACPFYTAMLYAEMIKSAGLTQVQVAEQIGRDKSYVSLYMNLAQVPREIWTEHQSALTSLRLCLEIAKAKDPEQQKKLVEAAAKGGLGTAAVKKLAKHLKGEGEPEKPALKSEFTFTRKGKAVVIKARPFESEQETFRDYLGQLEQAYTAFASQASSSSPAEPAQLTAAEPALPPTDADVGGSLVQPVKEAAIAA